MRICKVCGEQKEPCDMRLDSNKKPSRICKQCYANIQREYRKKQAYRRAVVRIKELAAKHGLKIEVFDEKGQAL